jgi:hypothetical protein
MWGSIDILKALDSTTTSGQALIPQIVDPYIAELALKVAPLRTLIPSTPWKSGTYDKNKRVKFGNARFVGDAVTIAESQSTIVRFQEPLKILMSKGGVTGFLQEASQELVDAIQLETKGHSIEAFHEEEYGLLYGNRYADNYQFNGLDTWIQTGVIDVNADLTFKAVDAGIDRILKIGGQPACLIMSHTMLSAFSRILFNQQRFLDKVEIKGGIKLLSYRDIPIYPTSFIGADKAWTGGTVTATAIDGGNLTASTDYYYKISAVLQTGETLPCSEATASTDDTKKTIKLTWSAPSESGSVRLYKIFRATSTGAETLLTVIPGVVYKQQDDLIGTLLVNDVVEWQDTGVYNSMTTDYTNGRVVGANYQPTKTEYPLVSGKEDIFIVSTEVPGVEGYATHRPTMKELGYMPLAKIADKEWFLIVGYETLVCVEQFCSKLHRVAIPS